MNITKGEKITFIVAGVIAFILGSYLTVCEGAMSLLIAIAALIMVIAVFEFGLFIMKKKFD